MIAILVLLAAALACGDSETQPSTKATPAPESAEYTLEVVGVEDPTEENSVFYEAEEGQKLVAVEIVVSNIEGETITVNPLNATLVDDEGFTYGAELAARDGGQIEVMDIAPGEKVRGWIPFEIPENAKPTSIKYSTSTFGGTTLQVNIE